MITRTKQQTENYQRTAVNFLFSVKAQGDLFSSTAYEWSITTKAGLLQISVGDDCCICTRFDNVEAAKALGLGDKLNPHSGKWNWMGGNDHAGDMADLDAFRTALVAII